MKNLLIVFVCAISFGQGAVANASCENLPKFLESVGTVPYYQGGQVSGLRIVSLPACAIHDGILQVGDILLSINDFTIDTPSKLSKIYDVETYNRKEMSLKIRREIIVDINSGQFPPDMSGK